MTKDKEHYIEFIEGLTDQCPPEFIESLEMAELTALAAYVQAVLDRERAGLDRFFQSMSQTIKYIPNFLLHTIVHKYIEPPIAARITVQLKFEQSVDLAAGLNPEYIAEAAMYLDNEYAARFLSALNRKKMVGVVACMMSKHPLKLIDILALCKNDILKLVEPDSNFMSHANMPLSDLRLSVFERLVK